MSFVVWDEKYDLGIENIDRDHKTLFDLFDQFHEAYAADKGIESLDAVFSVLLDYVETHFRREEKLMESIHYPNLASHHETHGALKEQVLDYYARFKRGDVKIGKTGVCLEILGFLKNWLHFHILEDDMAIRDFLNERKKI